MLHGFTQFFQAYAADLTDFLIYVNYVRRFMAVVENGTLIG